MKPLPNPAHAAQVPHACAHEVSQDDRCGFAMAGPCISPALLTRIFHGPSYVCACNLVPEPHPPPLRPAPPPHTLHSPYGAGAPSGVPTTLHKQESCISRHAHTRECMLAGEQPCHTRVWRRFHGEQTQSDKSHSRAPERRKRSWLEIESGGALVQSRINTYLIILRVALFISTTRNLLS